MDAGPETALVYPQWGHGCDKVHITPGMGQNAGILDFLLYQTPIQHQHACVFEVKTWWSYSFDLFETLSTSSIYEPGTGGFDWTIFSTTGLLIKQVLCVPAILTLLHLVSNYFFCSYGVNSLCSKPDGEHAPMVDIS